MQRRACRRAGAHTWAYQSSRPGAEADALGPSADCPQAAADGPAPSIRIAQALGHLERALTVTNDPARWRSCICRIRVGGCAGDRREWARPRRAGRELYQSVGEVRGRCERRPGSATRPLRARSTVVLTSRPRSPGRCDPRHPRVRRGAGRGLGVYMRPSAARGGVLRPGAGVGRQARTDACDGRGADQQGDSTGGLGRAVEARACCAGPSPSRSKCPPARTLRARNNLQTALTTSPPPTVAFMPRGATCRGVRGDQRRNQFITQLADWQSDGRATRCSMRSMPRGGRAAASLQPVELCCHSACTRL